MEKLGKLATPVYRHLCLVSSLVAFSVFIPFVPLLLEMGMNHSSTVWPSFVQNPHRCSVSAVHSPLLPSLGACPFPGQNRLPLCLLSMTVHSQTMISVDTSLHCHLCQAGLNCSSCPSLIIAWLFHVTENI